MGVLRSLPRGHTDLEQTYVATKSNLTYFCLRRRRARRRCIIGRTTQAQAFSFVRITSECEGSCCGYKCIRQTTPVPTAQTGSSASSLLPSMKSPANIHTSSMYRRLKWQLLSERSKRNTALRTRYSCDGARGYFRQSPFTPQAVRIRGRHSSRKTHGHAQPMPPPPPPRIRHKEPPRATRSVGNNKMHRQTDVLSSLPNREP